MTVIPPLFTHAETQRLGSDRQLRRARDSGDYQRVATGIYVLRSQWDALDLDDRYRVIVRAHALRSRPEAQFSHDSAAALWRLPSIGPWPSVAHELVGTHAGGHSRKAIKRHGLGRDPRSAVIDDVSVTSLTRTVVDMACTSSFVRAVAMLDCAQRSPVPREARWGMPAATQPMILAELDGLSPYRGEVQARRAIEFSTGLSGSPGESLARVQFHALRLPAPELQVEFVDELGSIGFVDFFWRELGLIGEFDGVSKYGARRLFQTGLTLHEILLREKDREDRLRRVSSGFVRLGWKLVNDRRALATELKHHGLSP